MEKLIIYPKEKDQFKNDVAVICPADNCGLTVEEIARKDVPDGVPYKIIDRASLPEDLEGFSPSFDAPDGFGIGHKKWFAERGISI